MSVPTILTDISATASSNSPTGSESVGSSLDDYLRGIQAALRGGLAYKGADIASATTTDLGAIAGLMHDITGTTTITGFGTVSAGIHKVIKFEGVLTLTHNGTSLILPGGASITTAVGDVAWMISEGSGNWRCLFYSKASGAAPKSIAPTRQILTSGSSATYTTPAGVAWVRIQMVGGGGGGAGGGASGANGGAGGVGGNTVFNTATANGGGAGTSAVSSGGTGGVTTGLSGAFSIPGGDGSAGTPGLGSTTGGSGGMGAASQLGGNGAGSRAATAGSAAKTNSGSGGGGGGGESTGAGGGFGGGGGAAGQYIEGYIIAPAASYTYTVGAAGSAGAAGSGGGAGGAGGAGIIIVEEFY